MQSVSRVMAGSMLMEVAVTGESLSSVIKEWRKRGCTISSNDEKALAHNFGRRQALDALKIELLHHSMDWAEKHAKDPELFKNLTPVLKPNMTTHGISVSLPIDGEDEGVI